MLDENNDGRNDIFNGYISWRGGSFGLQQSQIYLFFDYGFRVSNHYHQIKQKNKLTLGCSSNANARLYKIGFYTLKWSF